MARRSAEHYRSALIAGFLVIGVSGCSWLGLESSEVATDRPGRPEGIDGRPLAATDDAPTRLGGGDGLFDIIGGSDDDAGPQLPVNRYLWRATLDTLSFLPLASTDPYGGVIVTDWGASPEAPGERFKVTAYITSAELSPNSLRVVVNRQVQDASGVWVDAATAPETARALENAILTQARVLRSADPEG